MDIKVIIAFLHRIKCWTPISNVTVRNEIDEFINKLRNIR